MGPKGTEGSIQGFSEREKGPRTKSEIRKIPSRHHYLRIHYQGQACSCEGTAVGY